MRRSLITALGIFTVALVLATNVAAGPLTGDPSADGWRIEGNSFDKGVYANNASGAPAATFSFDIYSASFTLDTTDHAAIIDSFTGAGLDWLAGDRVIGLGGAFVDNTIDGTGWDPDDWQWAPYSAGGEEFNDDVSGSSNPQAKFGTDYADWSPSTVAPLKDGDGSASTSGGGFGTIHMRTQISFGDRTEDGNSTPDLPDLLRRVDEYGTSEEISKEFGRLIYIADGEVPESWQWLVNIDLLEREFEGEPTPLPGDLAISSVQRGPNRFTDGLTHTVPEPATMGLLGLGGLGVILKRKRQ